MVETEETGVTSSVVVARENRGSHLDWQYQPRYAVTMDSTRSLDDPCPIARTLSVSGKRWPVRIVAEAPLGRSRLTELRDHLGIAPDVPGARLSRLVAVGVTDVVEYRQPGDRTRSKYVPTEAIRELTALGFRFGDGWRVSTGDVSLVDLGSES